MINVILFILLLSFLVIYILRIILNNLTKISKHKYENLPYLQKKKIILNNFESIKNNDKIKLIKNENHLYRNRNNKNKNLDLNFLNKVIDINLNENYVHVEGLIRFDDLLDYTLQYGYIPQIVPELRSLTVGGVISGVGIESSSFKFGLFHDSVIEYEVLTGKGKILTANDNINKDLFNYFPNSYGSLGYIISAKIKIIKAKKYVHIQNIKYNNPKDFIDEIEKYKLRKNHDIDFIDGIIFDKDEMYLMKAKMISYQPEFTNTYKKNIYYKSIKNLENDYMTIKDYFWRYDSNYFYLGSDNHKIYENKFIRFFFNNILRSDKLRILGQNNIISNLFSSKNESIINDLSVKLNQFTLFLSWYKQNLDVFPVWICPYRTIRDTFFEKSNNYNIDFGIGFGNSVQFNKNHKIDENFYKKLIDNKMYELKNNKGLYSQTFLSENKFWEIYGPYDDYKFIKDKYDPDNKFYDLYSKVVNNS